MKNNPVDGDVQALIAFLKEKVASLKLAVKQRAFENVRDELVMDLKSAEISLAALTAEPVGEVVDVGGSRMVEWDRCISEGAKVYTTPPAQLLRQVEKPKTKCIGWLRETIQEHDEKWIIAIRKAGYEVKND